MPTTRGYTKMSLSVLFLWKNETNFIPVHYLFDSMDSAEAYAEHRESLSRGILDVRIQPSDKPATHTFADGKVYSIHGNASAWKTILGGILDG
jgi:hypothetical protein